MEMPKPLSPRSPSPRMRLPSVTTMASTSCAGQFQIIADCSNTAGFDSWVCTVAHLLGVWQAGLACPSLLDALALT